MSEATKTENNPTLSADHRTEILFLQRKDLTLRMNMLRIQNEIDQLPNILNGILAKIFTELGIDMNAYVFDLETLEIKPKA